MDFMHTCILGQKEAIWNTIFSGTLVFLSDGGAHKRHGARENLPPFPTLSTGLIQIAIV